MQPADPKNNSKLRLPRLRSAKLENFSLYSLNPEIDVEFNDGVFCLAGANGLGKSTFLLALNYAITGIVAEPGRPFRSVEEYYNHCIEFSSEFFSGRILERDRDVACISVTFDIGQKRYSLTRDMFNPKELRAFTISNGLPGKVLLDTRDNSPGERHSLYANTITEDCGLPSFYQLVFLQHFVLKFDERRHLLFWNPRELEHTLYLAFGVDQKDASRAETLRRQIERAESRARNHNYQATQIRNNLHEIEKSTASIAAAAEAPKELGEMHADMESQVRSLAARAGKIASKLNDAILSLSEHSASQSALRAEYNAEFAKRLKSQTHVSRHPLVAGSVREGTCGLCGTKGPEIRKAIESRVAEKQCPLCNSPLSASKAENGAFAILRKLDEKLAKESVAIEEAINQRARFDEELQTAAAARDDAIVRLSEFEKANEGALSKLAAESTTGINVLVENLRDQMRHFLTEKHKEYGRRDELKKELKPLQKRLKARYAAVEDEFVPLFTGFARSFLGLDLDLQIESIGSAGIGMTVDVKGQRRREPHQLSESQRFFIDIALRMALVKFMSEEDWPGCLYIDTPEGSLDIAYETTAGKMFADFVEGGFGIIMTANINSSQILRALAENCGPKRMQLERMTTWTELSDVQESGERLFDSAFAEIERALRKGGKPRA